MDTVVVFYVVWYQQSGRRRGNKTSMYKIYQNAAFGPCAVEYQTLEWVLARKATFVMPSLLKLYLQMYTTSISKTISLTTRHYKHYMNVCSSFRARSTLVQTSGYLVTIPHQRTHLS
ncbi:hypothetical protein PS15m_011433 [Mucor circinelloides]